MTFQTAFENTMQAQQHISEDPSFSFEVRNYARTIFMTMQAQQRLIELQEQETVEELVVFFSHH